jgi:hypothetical protein
VPWGPTGNTLSTHNAKLRREVWELKQTVQEFSKEREKHKEYVVTTQRRSTHIHTLSLSLLRCA